MRTSKGAVPALSLVHNGILTAHGRGLVRKGVAVAEKAGAGVLWTSHNMYEVAEVCDRVLFLSRGRILLSGEPAALVREHGAAPLEDLFVSVAHEAPKPDAAEAS